VEASCERLTDIIRAGKTIVAIDGSMHAGTIHAGVQSAGVAIVAVRSFQAAVRQGPGRRVLTGLLNTEVCRADVVIVAIRVEATVSRPVGYALLVKTPSVTAGIENIAIAGACTVQRCRALRIRYVPGRLGWLKAFLLF